MQWTCAACTSLVALLCIGVLRSGGVTHYTVDNLPVYKDYAAPAAHEKLPLSVTPEMKENYSKDGFVVVRQLLTDAWVSQLLQVSKAVLRERSASNNMALAKVAAMYTNWPENPAVSQFLFDSGVARVVSEVVQTDELRLLDDFFILASTPHARGDVNKYDMEKHQFGNECWHSDSFSFGNLNEKDLGYSLWMPLVDVPRKLGGSVAMCSRSVVQATNCTHMTQCKKPKAGEAPDRCEAALAKACPMSEFKAGDAVVFAADTLHQTEGWIDPSFTRFTFVARFVDGKGTYKPRLTPYMNGDLYKVRYDMCSHGLRYQDKFGGPCFPRVHPKPLAREVHGERRYVRPSVISWMSQLEKFVHGAMK